MLDYVEGQEDPIELNSNKNIYFNKIRLGRPGNTNHPYSKDT